MVKGGGKNFNMTMMPRVLGILGGCRRRICGPRAMRCCEAALCYLGPVEKLCWGAWGEAREGEVWEFLGSPVPRSLIPCMQGQERSEEHVSDDGHRGEKRDVWRHNTVP